MDRVAVGLLALILLALPVYSIVFPAIYVEPNALPGIGTTNVTSVRCPTDDCTIGKVRWVTTRNGRDHIVQLDRVEVKFKPDSAEVPGTFDVYVIVYGAAGTPISSGDASTTFREVEYRTVSVDILPDVNIKDVKKIEIFIVAREPSS